MMQTKQKSDVELSRIACFYTILGVLGVFISLLLGVGAWVGHALGQEPPDVQLVLGIISLIGVLGSLFLSVGLIVVGRAIKQRRLHSLCVVVSVLLCFCFPLGTALGVYSLTVLRKTETKELFGE